MTDVQLRTAASSFSRRQSDLILIAFEQACVSNRQAIAADLLNLLEQELYREDTFPGAERRNAPTVLAEAQARLEALRAASSKMGRDICSAALISLALSVRPCALKNDLFPHADAA